ncbi:MAG: hypothetical protein ACO3A2_10760 [Bdellovibrionia bacterium]
MSKVIDLSRFRKPNGDRRSPIAPVSSEMQEELLGYQARVLGFSKTELLNEVIAFQNERKKTESLTLKAIVFGQVLFSALEQRAEIAELKQLARSYRRHLQFEHLARFSN